MSDVTHERRVWHVEERPDDPESDYRIPPLTSKDVILLLSSPQPGRDGLLLGSLSM